MESHQTAGPSSKISTNSETTLIPKFNSLNCVENHLQSLGFVINNGEARLKLDEAAINAGGNTDFSIIDAEDPASFVVLGKDSMESIQASCLASYMDIQQKSVSVDYNSMISSLDSSDVHQKLMELLQENERLKEALKQNNTAMKQQISTLTSWQEEMMKVHQDHKQKFGETTELIKYLKKENCELKMKLSMDQFDNSETGFNIIDDNACKDRQDREATSAERAKWKVASVEDDVITSQLKCAELFNEVGKLMTLSEVLNSEIKETASIQENVQVSSSNSNMNQSQIQNQIEYITGLRESKDFCQNSKDKCNKITKSLDDAIKILDEKLEKNEMKFDMNHYKEVMSLNSKGRQQRSMIVDLQNRVKNSLSECESTLCDLTTQLREQESEIPDASGSEKATGKLETDMLRLLKEEKLSLIKKRESVDMLRKEQLKEQEMLMDRKKSLEIERQKLIDERNLIMQKKQTLDEEKTSLDQQSQLYESSVATLQAEKKVLESKCDTLTTEAELTKAILTKNDNELKEMQKKIKQQEETIYSLEVQMKVYEEDFTRERKMKDALLLDHNKVVADLVSQMEFSKHLQTQISCLKSNTETAGIQSPEILSIACPKCQSVFRDGNSLEQHVENCLNLH